MHSYLLVHVRKQAVDVGGLCAQVPNILVVLALQVRLQHVDHGVLLAEQRLCGLKRDSQRLEEHSS